MPLLFALLLSISNPSLITIPRVEAETLTSDDLRVIATADAVHYGLNTDHFLKVINRESGFNPNAVNPTSNASGIVQILPSAHPDITKEEMFDPIWSLNWAAEEWSEGHQSMWEAWDQLYGK
jgi:soluble lytic murein transglycosylase-like protein